MADQPDEVEEALKRIFQPDIKPTLTDKEERKFFPWHKPRKHYLRIYQWCAEIRELINLNKYQDGDVLHYLGFPGEDFLDIRALQAVCTRANVRLRYLGFDSTAIYAGREFQFNLAKHEVYHLGFIHEHSSVLKTRIETLANESSIAYKRTARFREFDIINIDLCDSLASPTDKPHPPYFDAIKKLCDLQVTGRTRPWVLFLTTRAIRDQIDAATKWKLFDCVVRNIREHAEFATQLAEEFDLDDGKIRNELSDKEPLDHGTLVNLFGLSIGKWLLRMMLEATPKLRVRLLKSYRYRVEIDEPDMLSLAFMFEPVINPPLDRSGLTPATKEPDPKPNERQLAIDLLKAICGIGDIDQFLHENEDTHAKMVQKCGDLLATVRYDKDSYEKWVARNRWRPR
jgi:hypothetical protein